MAHDTSPQVAGTALAARVSVDLFDLDSGQGTPMPSGPPHALPAFLLEDADLRTSHLAVDDPDDSSIGDEGRPGHHRTIGLLDEEHLMEGHFLTGPGLETVDNDRATRHDLDLPPAALNDGVHVHPFRRSTDGTRERAPSALDETISVLLLREGCKDRATRPKGRRRSSSGLVT